jgi:hypothetical protein
MESIWLGRAFQLERKDLRGGMRKLHHEGIHNL